MWRPLSNPLRMISVPALPNPTCISDPILNIVLMRKEVSMPVMIEKQRQNLTDDHDFVWRQHQWTIPFKTSLPQFELGSFKFSSSISLWNWGELKEEAGIEGLQVAMTRIVRSLTAFCPSYFWYPSGSFMSIERSNTIRSIGSTTSVIIGPANAMTPMIHTTKMKIVVTKVRVINRLWNHIV